MGGDVNIAFSQILTRTDRNIFNKKSKDFNKRLEYMCKKSTKNDHLHYIPQVELLTPQSKYDGVHLRDWGVKQLVCNIKAIVNPLLGLPRYTTYKTARDTHYNVSKTQSRNQQPKGYGDSKSNNNAFMDTDFSHIPVRNAGVKSVNQVRPTPDFTRRQHTPEAFDWSPPSVPQPSSVATTMPTCYGHNAWTNTSTPDIAPQRVVDSNRPIHPRDSRHTWPIPPYF